MAWSQFRQGKTRLCVTSLFKKKKKKGEFQSSWMEPRDDEKLVQCAFGVSGPPTLQRQTLPYAILILSAHPRAAFASFPSDLAHTRSPRACAQGRGCGRLQGTSREGRPKHTALTLTDLRVSSWEGFSQGKKKLQLLVWSSGSLSLSTKTFKVRWGFVLCL